MVENRHFSIPGRSPLKSLDLPVSAIDEPRSEDVIFGNDAFEGRVNHFFRGCRQHIEIKMMTIDSTFENLIEQLDVFLEPDLFSDFEQVLLANFRVEFRIVQQ